MLVLETWKLARKFNLDRPTSHYELTDCQRYRDRLVCIACGRITPLETASLVERIQRHVARKHNFTQVRRSLEFFGRCGWCSDPKSLQ